MRKSLIILICILVMGIVFISGCTSDDKTNSKSLTDSQSNQQSDAETPNLIIKPRDVSGLSLIEYSFRAFPKSSNYIYEGRFAFGAESGEIEYKDVLPLGTRNVGEISSWGDDSGRSIGIGLRKFDSNSELEDVAVEFTEMIEEFNKNIDLYKDAGQDKGDPHIGDHSIYMSYTPDQKQPDIESTILQFISGNSFINVIVTDEKDKSLNEAIRIAKIIESRLD